VGDDNKLTKKQLGEREPGTFHYNPGNMSGKKIGRELQQGDRVPSDAGSVNDNPTETARGTTIASELIMMTQNNPLGFLAGAALAGIVIGVFLGGETSR
jgi:hypothetical protein